MSSLRDHIERTLAESDSAAADGGSLAITGSITLPPRE
jgi:hypothetical protein